MNTNLTIFTKQKRGRDDISGFLLSPICATNGKHCSTDGGAMAQIDYEKKLKAFSIILPHFLICIQIEDRGIVTLT